MIYNPKLYRVIYTPEPFYLPKARSLSKACAAAFIYYISVVINTFTCNQRSANAQEDACVGKEVWSVGRGQERSLVMRCWDGYGVNKRRGLAGYVLRIVSLNWLGLTVVEGQHGLRQNSSWLLISMLAWILAVLTGVVGRPLSCSLLKGPLSFDCSIRFLTTISTSGVVSYGSFFVNSCVTHVCARLGLLLRYCLL